MSVYGQKQVAGIMAGLGGSYTPARAAAEELSAAPAPAPQMSGGAGGSAPPPNGIPIPSQPTGRMGLANTSPTQANRGQASRYNVAAQAQAGKSGVIPGQQAGNAVLQQEQMGQQMAMQEQLRRQQQAAAQYQNPNDSALAGYMMGQ